MPFVPSWSRSVPSRRRPLRGHRGLGGRCHRSGATRAWRGLRPGPRGRSGLGASGPAHRWRLSRACQRKNGQRILTCHNLGGARDSGFQCRPFRVATWAAGGGCSAQPFLPRTAATFQPLCRQGSEGAPTPFAPLSPSILQDRWNGTLSVSIRTARREVEHFREAPHNSGPSLVHRRVRCHRRGCDVLLERWLRLVR